MQHACYQGSSQTNATQQRLASIPLAENPNFHLSSPVYTSPINPAFALRRPSPYSPVTPEILVMPAAVAPSPQYAASGNHNSIAKHDPNLTISVAKARATPSPQQRGNSAAYLGHSAPPQAMPSHYAAHAAPAEGAKPHTVSKTMPPQKTQLEMPVPEIPLGVREELARNENVVNLPGSQGYPPYPSSPPALNGFAQILSVPEQQTPSIAPQEDLKVPDLRFSPSSLESNVQIAQMVPLQPQIRAPFSNSEVYTSNRKYQRFGSESGAHASELTVDQFETVRRQASAQPHDPRTQLELVKCLCEASEFLASKYTDPFHPSTLEVDERQQARNREAWTTQALKIAKRLATKVQYTEALFFLGSVYSSGKHGVETDYIKALDYYQKAARLEHPESCYRVAVCEEFGVGTKCNAEKAVSWYKKAAMLGSAASMYKLGMLSMLGNLDQPRDFSAGLSWLQRAAAKADAKNPHAVHEMALLYEHSPLSPYTNGDNIPYNAAKSLEYYYIAAKLGYAPSQARLGRAFEFGELGCNIDSNQSISWYSQAAQQGDTDAELAMAGWYWTGATNFRKSDVEAFLWAERAASKGNARAMYAIGYFCELGIGVKRDLHRSTKWYVLAAERKHPRAIYKLKLLGSEAATS